MNPLAKQKKTFEPQFLFVDNLRIKTRLEESKELEQQLNEATAQVKKLFKEPLTDAEIIAIMKKGFSKVVEIARQKAGFPGAEPETLFKLMGVDPLCAKNALTKIRNRHQVEEFDFKTGQFELSKEAIQKFEEVATYYTKSEEANTALQIAQNLCKELNKALKNGLVNYPSQGERTAPVKALDNLISEKVIEVKKRGAIGQTVIVEYYPNYDKIRFL